MPRSIDIRQAADFMNRFNDSILQISEISLVRKTAANGTLVHSLVGLILCALKSGGVFIIDELECSLHPLLMRELVLLIKKRRLNPTSAGVMNLVRMSASVSAFLFMPRAV